MGRDAKGLYTYEYGGWLSEILPPAGKAPPGLRGEYAARREIVRMFTSVENTISRQGAILRGFRGLSKDSRREDNARARLFQARQAHREMSAVVGAGGDWRARRDLIRYVYTARRAEISGMR